MTQPRPLRLLVVEDEPQLANLIARMMQPYGVETTSASTAKVALPQLLPDSLEARPDAVFLDLMFPYGDEVTRQKLAGPEQDEEERDTGVHLLRELRLQEHQRKWEHLWVAVTTARNAPKVLDRVREHLAGHGRIYGKPYDDIALELELCRVLGLRCMLDQAFVELFREGATDGS